MVGYQYFLNTFLLIHYVCEQCTKFYSIFQSLLIIVSIIPKIREQTEKKSVMTD